MLRRVLEDTHKRCHSQGAFRDRRFVGRHAATSARRSGTTDPLSKRVDQGTHGLDVMAEHAHSDDP